MAAVTKVDVSFIAPPGMEFGDTAYTLTDLEVGDPIIIDPAAPPTQQYSHSIRKATGTEAHGFALKKKKAGGFAEYVTQGEFDGYAGLAPGTSLSIVGGNVDTTPTGAGVTPSIRVINASRIRVMLV